MLNKKGFTEIGMALAIGAVSFISSLALFQLAAVKNREFQNLMRADESFYGGEIAATEMYFHNKSVVTIEAKTEVMPFVNDTTAMMNGNINHSNSLTSPGTPLANSQATLAYTQQFENVSTSAVQGLNGPLRGEIRLANSSSRVFCGYLGTQNGTCLAMIFNSDVKSIEIADAVIDGHFQFLINYTTGMLKMRNCAGHQPGCVTNSKSANVGGGGVFWPGISITYMDGRVEQNMWMKRDLLTLYDDRRAHPLGELYLPVRANLTNYGPTKWDFQLPGNWKKIVAAEMTIRCPSIVASDRRPTSNNAHLSPSWKDRIHIYGTDRNWVGVEVDDSNGKESGYFHLPTTLHLSQNGSTFVPPLPAKAPSWQQAGTRPYSGSLNSSFESCNDEPGIPN